MSFVGTGKGLTFFLLYCPEYLEDCTWELYLRYDNFRSLMRPELDLDNETLDIVPTVEACGCRSTLIIGWGPFLFGPLPLWPSRSLPAHVQTGKFSLTWGVGTLFLYFSRAQLLPLVLSLECLGENKASVLLHLTNTSSLTQRPIKVLSHPYQTLCVAVSITDVILILRVSPVFLLTLPRTVLCSKSLLCHQELCSYY